MGAIDFPVLSHQFTHFSLLLWSGGGLVSGFFAVVISLETLQEVGRDNLDILQTSKFCLLYASGVYTTCQKIYLHGLLLNSLNCG